MTESKNRFSRSDIASFLAVTLSIAALAIGIVEAKIMADQQDIMAQQQKVMVEQQKGSVWPYVEVKNSIQMENLLSFSSSAENKGVGPAIIKEIKIEMKGETYNSFDTFKTSLDSIMGEKNYELTEFGISENVNSVYAPGERETLFFFIFKDQAAFFKNIGFFSLTVTYCSIYGDCWRENGQEIEETDLID